MDSSFFTTPDGEWFQPTDSCRGPWNRDACHAGPPIGLLVRASERAMSNQQLARITVDLVRPIPQAGFRITTEVLRAGRTVSTTLMRLLDVDDREVLTARGLHQATDELAEVPTTPYLSPPLADATHFPWPLGPMEDDGGFFSEATQVRFYAGDPGGAGPRELWMRTIPLLPDEEPSPFQRVCPLADNSNAFGRNVDHLGEWAFMNTDLTIQLHRLPTGDWIGSDVVGRWEPSGIGMAYALLFDQHGAIGRAIATLLVRPLPPE